MNRFTTRKSSMGHRSPFPPAVMIVSTVFEWCIRPYNCTYLSYSLWERKKLIDWFCSKFSVVRTQFVGWIRAFWIFCCSTEKESLNQRFFDVELWKAGAGGLLGLSRGCSIFWETCLGRKRWMGMGGLSVVTLWVLFFECCFTLRPGWWLMLQRVYMMGISSILLSKGIYE